MVLSLLRGTPIYFKMLESLLWSRTKLPQILGNLQIGIYVGYIASFGRIMAIMENQVEKSGEKWRRDVKAGNIKLFLRSRVPA